MSNDDGAKLIPFPDADFRRAGIRKYITELGQKKYSEPDYFFDSEAVQKSSFEGVWLYAIGPEGLRFIDSYLFGFDRDAEEYEAHTRSIFQRASEIAECHAEPFTSFVLRAADGKNLAPTISSFSFSILRGRSLLAWRRLDRRK